MPSFFKSAAALAMAGSAVANPLIKRFTPAPDACLAAVTGKAALGDDSLRKEHCTSFFKTIVTPAAVTVTTTITDAPKPSDFKQWEKKDVTVCPNEVPNYASACDLSGYSSACKAWGVVSETTFTIPATTTTKTVYFGGKDATCPVATVTKTEAGSTSTVAGSTTTVAGSTTTTTFTVTAAGNTYTGPGATGTAITTVTVTVPASSGSFPTGAPFQNGTNDDVNIPSIPGCLTADKAKEFTDAFKNLLEYTNAGVPGVSAPYNANISAKYLAEDFKDYSDSINWMSGRTLGGVTFASRAEFDTEQGSGQQPIVVTDQLTHFSCKTITWKWQAYTSTGGNVMGINLFIINDDLTQIKENHAEFNSASWVQSLTNIPIPAFAAINCVVPDLSGGASSGNGTAPASSTVSITSTVAATVTATLSSDPVTSTV